MEAIPFLIHGKGATPANGGCIMQIVSWLQDGGWSDSPTCVHPRLRRWAIETNDWSDDVARQSLILLTSRLMGTRHALVTGPPAETLRFLTIDREAGRHENVLSNRYTTAYHKIQVKYGQEGIATLTSMPPECQEELNTLEASYRRIRAKHAWETLNKLLDITDELVPRPTELPDFSGVCAVMAGVGDGVA